MTQDFRFHVPLILPPPPPPPEHRGPDISAPGQLGRGVSLAGLHALGPSLFDRLRQLIIDEMPTGEHLERAAAWRRLGERCFKTAEKHQKTAEKRQETKRILSGFAPQYRQQVLDTLIAGGDPVALKELQQQSQAPAYGDPENGTWRPLSQGERSTRQVYTRQGVRWLTEQEQRDGRTAEPPAAYFWNTLQTED